MLTPDYYEKCTDDIIELFSQLNERITKDMARRIIKSGKLTETAKWQLGIEREAGRLYDEILADISKYTGESKKTIQDIFEKAGIEKHLFEKTKHYTVTEPVYYLNGKTSLVILPADDLYISYAVNYDHPDLTRRWVAYNPKNKQEIIEARTFGFYKDLKKFQMLGFAQGVTIENTLGLKEDGYTSELRSENEPIKHKILDLIGDLYLTGVNPLNLRCQILVKEAGHAVHIKTAKLLKDKLIECK